MKIFWKFCGKKGSKTGKNGQKHQKTPHFPHFYKSMEFFTHWGIGANPKSTLLKKCEFSGGVGVQFPHFFRYFFFKNCVIFHPVFVGLKVIFRVKLKKNFFSPKCVSTLEGGGWGSGRCGKNPHFLLFLKASLRCQ